MSCMRSLGASIKKEGNKNEYVSIGNQGAGRCEKDSGVGTHFPRKEGGGGHVSGLSFGLNQGSDRARGQQQI